MEKDIQIPFHFRLSARESKFHIDIPRQYQNDFNRQYSFGTVTLVPDYFKQEAQKYEDETVEGQFEEISEEAILDFQILPNLFVSEKKEFVIPNEDLKIGNIMQLVNNHYELFRPGSIARAPFFIDWHHETMDEFDTIDSSFFEASSYLFYQEPYIEDRHSNFLPASVRTLPEANNFLYPNVLDTDIISGIRIVLNIAPNTTVWFSNDRLLTILGFSPQQIGPRGKLNRFYFDNKEPVDYLCVVAENSPTQYIIKSLGAGVTKMSLLPFKEEFSSPPFKLQTTKLREKKPTLLAVDWNKSISDAALRSNIIFGLEYNLIAKQFQFRYPSNNFVRVSIRMSLDIAKRLGFNEERITERSPVATITPENDIMYNERRSKALVYATGMVFISFDNMRSNTTSGILDQYMGSLRPKDPGVLQKEKLDNSPAVNLPNYTSRLHFTLSHFDPEIKPLDWITGSFIEGELIGKV